MLIINLQTHATAGGCGVDLESTVSSSHLQEFRKLPTNTATRIAPRRAALSPCALQFRCFSACSREPRSAKRLLRLMLLLLSTGNGCSFLRTFDDEPRPAADLFSRQLTKRHRPVRLVVVASSSRKKKQQQKQQQWKSSRIRARGGVFSKQTQRKGREHHYDSAGPAAPPLRF